MQLALRNLYVPYAVITYGADFLVLMLDLTLIFELNFRPMGSLHDAAEGAYFFTVDPDPTNIKIAYNLVLLTGIQLMV